MEGPRRKADPLALHKHCQDRFEMLIGELFQLVVGSVLDRVGNEYQSRVDAERVCLRGRTLDEFGGRDADSWNATRFEIRHVMRTARNAGPSVGQPFDDEIDLSGDLLP
jgi:hypothetical protein